MDMKIIVEEAIWDIARKTPIRACILTRNGNVLTRQLYHIDNLNKQNNKIDTIDLNKVNLKINLMEAKELSVKEIGKRIKKLSLEYNPELLIIKHLEDELKGFDNPQISYEYPFTPTLGTLPRAI